MWSCGLMDKASDFYRITIIHFLSKIAGSSPASISR